MYLFGWLCHDIVVLAKIKYVGKTKKPTKDTKEKCKLHRNIDVAANTSWSSFSQPRRLLTDTSSTNCTQTLASLLEEINYWTKEFRSTWNEQERAIREELNNVHAVQVKKLPADMQRQAAIGVAQLQQDFEVSYKGEIDLIHKAWGERLNRAAAKWEAALELERTMRLKAEQQVTHLKQQLGTQCVSTENKQGSVDPR